MLNSGADRPQPDRTDDELIRRYCAGDPAAFRTLFERHHRRVYSFARMMLHDDAAAEDVLQETFAAVAASAQRYQACGRFRLWLMRIVRNRCLDWLEHERRRPVQRLESALSSRRPSPPQQLEAAETMELIERALRQLPPRQRAALLLFSFERMSYREIGEVMAVPVNTVKTLIHRARAAIAEALQENEP